MNIFHVYGYHPGKTTLSVLLVIIGAVTFFKYQTLEISTFQIAIEQLLGDHDKKNIFLTWFLNIFSAAGLGAIGILWLKDSVKQIYDTDQLVSTIICVLMGVLMIGLSISFFQYLFSSLMGLVVLACIGFAIVYGNSSSNR